MLSVAQAKDAASPVLLAPVAPAATAAPIASSRSDANLTTATPVAPVRTVETVVLASLPPEAQAMNRLIRSGGPFEHSKDASVFGNRERALPVHPRGWYREYTVATPKARHRGARRIVCGGAPLTAPQDCYYTSDHYTTFQRIVP